MNDDQMHHTSAQAHSDQAESAPSHSQMSQNQRDVTRDLLARVERLERRERRFVTAGLACLLGFTCIAVMAQTTAKKKATKPAAVQPPAAPAAPPGPTVVEAEGFVLKDLNGKVRAELGMSGTGPSLKLRDESGTALVTIALNDNAPGGPFVLLSDPQHHASLNMSALDGAGSQLALIGDRPEVQVHMGVAPAGTTFELTDKDGFGATIGNTIQTTKNGKIKNTSGASVVLFDKERKTVWSTP